MTGLHNSMCLLYSYSQPRTRSICTHQLTPWFLLYLARLASKSGSWSVSCQFHPSHRIQAPITAKEALWGFVSFVFSTTDSSHPPLESTTLDQTESIHPSTFFMLPPQYVLLSMACSLAVVDSALSQISSDRYSLVIRFSTRAAQNLMNYTLYDSVSRTFD